MTKSNIEICDRLVNGYMEAIHTVYGDTIDMAEVASATAAFLKQCVKFITRSTGNYSETMKGICGILMQDPQSTFLSN